MLKNLIINNLKESQSVLEAFLQDVNNIDAINNAGLKLVSAFAAGNKVVSCGNGGSMSDAMHFAEELSGRFRENRKALPAIAISDPAHITCVANDFGFDHIFSRYVEALGNKGDVLFAISTSGNSANVLKAVAVAKQKGMVVIGLTGNDGGKLASLCDVEIRVPHTGYSDRIQEIHIKVIHILIHYIESSINE
jgi:D-sedoheptulose 7-phosphate isomerase